jgi:Transposase IS66 family
LIAGRAWLFPWRPEPDGIGALHGIEEKARFAPPAEVLAHSAETGPRLDDFVEWAERTVAKLSAKSALAEAFRYTIKRWGALARFVTDAPLEIWTSPRTPCVASRSGGRTISLPIRYRPRAAAAKYSIVQTSGTVAAEQPRTLGVLAGELRNSPVLKRPCLPRPRATFSQSETHKLVGQSNAHKVSCTTTRVAGTLGGHLFGGNRHISTVQHRRLPASRGLRVTPWTWSGATGRANVAEFADEEGIDLYVRHLWCPWKRASPGGRVACLSRAYDKGAGASRAGR